MTDYSVSRNQWGQPYVSTDGLPLQYEKGRKTPTNAVGYTRVSTLAGVLDDKSGLVQWAAANAAVGVVRDRAVFAQLSHLASAYRDPWADPIAKKQLKPLVERAQQSAGSDDASGLGTAFHGLTELIDAGQTPEFMPEQFVPWVAKYKEALTDWEVLDSEPFVVCDELQTAGSLDRLLRHRETGQVVVADIKTGKSDPQFPLKVSLQVALYAHSERYDQATGKRTPLHPDIDLTAGVLIHAPVRSARPRCTLYPLDLTAGWELAKLAVRVRELRKMKALVAL